MFDKKYKVRKGSGQSRQREGNTWGKGEFKRFLRPDLTVDVFGNTKGGPPEKHNASLTGKNVRTGGVARPGKREGTTLSPKKKVSQGKRGKLRTGRKRSGLPLHSPFDPQRGDLYRGTFSAHFGRKEGEKSEKKKG